MITKKEAKVERFPWGPLEWLCRPDIIDTREILVVRVNVARGKGQSFHRQPSLEEVIYILEGKAEVWLGEEPREIGPDETVHVPADAVHATFNVGAGTLRFLSIFAPARFKGPALVDLSDREPWRSLAAGRASHGRASAAARVERIAGVARSSSRKRKRRAPAKSAPAVRSRSRRRRTQTPSPIEPVTPPKERTARRGNRRRRS